MQVQSRSMQLNPLPPLKREGVELQLWFCTMNLAHPVHYITHRELWKKLYRACTTQCVEDVLWVSYPLLWLMYLKNSSLSHNNPAINLRYNAAWSAIIAVSMGTSCLEKAWTNTDNLGRWVLAIFVQEDVTYFTTQFGFSVLKFNNIVTHHHRLELWRYFESSTVSPQNRISNDIQVFFLQQAGGLNSSLSNFWFQCVNLDASRQTLAEPCTTYINVKLSSSVSGSLSKSVQWWHLLHTATSWHWYACSMSFWYVKTCSWVLDIYSYAVSTVSHVQ